MELTINILIILIFQLIYILTQFIVGGFLTYKIIKIRLFNLFPLILFFTLNTLEGIILFMEPPYIFEQTLIFISNISLIIFTKYTFFKNTKSKFKIYLYLVLALKTVDFGLKFIIPFSLVGGKELIGSDLIFHSIFVAIMCCIVLISYLWLSVTSLTYYNYIKVYKIEPWIKKRYIILGISSLFAALNGIIYLFFPPNAKNIETLQTFIIALFIVINTVIFSIGNLIGWLMPKPLKNYFNRNFEPLPEEQFSEKELMEKIKSQLSERRLK